MFQLPNSKLIRRHKGPVGPVGSVGRIGRTGAAGVVGPTGPAGTSSGASPVTRQTMTYSSTTTDADPGAGTFRLNSTTIDSITKIYFDLQDVSANDLTAFLDNVQLSDKYRTTYLRISDTSTPPKEIVLRITGFTTASGYRKFDALVVGSPSTLTLVNASNYTCQWSTVATDSFPLPPAPQNGTGFFFGLPGFTPVSTTTSGYTHPSQKIEMFTITRPIYIDSIFFNVSTNRTTCTSRLLIYKMRSVIGGDVVGGALVYDNGTSTTDCTTTGTKTKSGINTILEPGSYAIVLATDTGSGSALVLKSMSGGFDGGPEMAVPVGNAFRVILDITNNSSTWTGTPPDPMSNGGALSVNTVNWTIGTTRCLFMKWYYL